ncbi:MAG: 4Fe-4S binding protein [candidate division WS1 bacterium]|nr:4Fe-4S binding protein [candidate division WS1 bacterium]
MLTSADLKAYALENGLADKLGVANIERFQGAPPDMDPLKIMPRARSVVVFIKRILRSSYRGIDEGTHWPSYTIFGYQGLNARLGESAYDLACFIEDHGYEAAATAAMATYREAGGPHWAGDASTRTPYVVPHYRIAATLAGLGEIGWSKVFLTREFGPRQRIGIVLTEAELEPDPIVTGEICDRCGACVRECPADAIAAENSVVLEVEGHRLEWNDLDLGKCKLTHHGLNRCSAPFLIKKYPGLYLPMPEQEVTWREAWDLGWAVFPSVPAYAFLARWGVPALCGARGCIIACMKHLEKRGRVENEFNTRPGFSEGEPWRLPAQPEHVEHHGFVCNPEDQD